MVPTHGDDGDVGGAAALASCAELVPAIVDEAITHLRAASGHIQD